ncbi:MAG: YfaZ family outer membrane protein [Campylobacterota bacterium]|nr:YfaZ family outer membrane protein [Campylobacterota bacterium]
MLKKIGLLLVCAVSAFAMHNIELNVNNKDLEFTAKLDMGQFNDSIEPDTVFIGAKILHGSENHSDFEASEDIHDYTEMNFLMNRNIGDTGVKIGLGLKVNYTENFLAIPLGVEASYQMPFLTDILPMHLGVLLYYAPDVLSMNDAKNFLEYRAEFDAEVITNAHIIIGYRNLDTNYDDSRGNINYNRSPYIGFKFAF